MWAGGAHMINALSSIASRARAARGLPFYYRTSKQLPEPFRTRQISIHDCCTTTRQQHVNTTVRAHTRVKMPQGEPR